MSKKCEKSENVDAEEGLAILQAALDWCGELGARVVWFVDRRGSRCLNLRVSDLRVEIEASDPITGLLEAIEQMKERLARRKINAGI